jgi:hypothetical protein
LPVRFTANYIDNEQYWEEACKRWEVVMIESHGYSYKQMFIEKNLEEAISDAKVISSFFG